MSEQRTRLVLERAAAAAVDLRELGATLAEADEARREITKYRRTVRQTFARLPALAARKVTATDPAVASAQLARLIRPILEKLTGPQ